MTLVARFLRDESAATAIEYGLIATLIALVVIAALNNVSAKMVIKFTAVATALR